jgi:hypothetical protein
MLKPLTLAIAALSVAVPDAQRADWISPISTTYRGY